MTRIPPNMADTIVRVAEEQRLKLELQLSCAHRTTVKGRCVFCDFEVSVPLSEIHKKESEARR